MNRGVLIFDGSRTPLKTVLFLTVCAAWILPGLVGHDPWKTDEAIVFGLVHEILRTGDPVLLSLAGTPFFERAPLYLWVAAALAKLLGGLLPLHDAARLASGLFMAATLACVSAASRELLGERAMRVSVLLLIGCLGLLIRAHEMSSDLAALAGIALALYGLALGLRRPRVGGLVAGAGIGVAFLGDGFVPLAMLLALLAALPAAHAAWRTREYAWTAALALICAAPLVFLWPALLGLKGAGWLQAWLDASTVTRWSSTRPATLLGELFYFLRILPWYAWPAWPLAAWTLWRARRTLLARKGLMLPLVAFASFLAVLMLVGEPREVSAMPLLLPLAILGVAELDTLPRGGASALDWFGMTTFFLFATMIWVGWIAVMTGQPAGVLAWIHSEVPGYRYPFSFIAFALAALLTLVWLAVIARSLRSTRRALVNWAAGITMVWMLAMALGLPLIDHARSYRVVAAGIVRALPPGFTCVASMGLGEPQRALLDYFVALRTIRVEFPAAAQCQALLVQANLEAGRPTVGPQWRETWRGSRPGDRKEAFIVYARASR